MPTITRRLRTVLRPTPTESEDLEALRVRTRAVLNRPYRFEPKAFIKPWETQGDDPFSGLFKPFSKALPLSLASPVASAGTVAQRHSFLFLIPVVLIGLGLAAFIGWQAWKADSNLHSLTLANLRPPTVSVNPTSGTSNPNPASVSIPSNTPLQPSGPYSNPGSSGQTGLTGRSQPATNMYQSGNGDSQASGRTSSNGGTSSNGTTPSCSSGYICSGYDLSGKPCTTSSPCQEVSVSSLSGSSLYPAALTSQYILNNEPSCPCVLIH